MTPPTTGRGAIISLGRIYCDFVFTGLADLPRLGREVFAQDMTLALGGGAFITAAHVAARGRKSALLARYGTDPLSLSLEHQLQLPGLDLRFLDRHRLAGPQVTAVIVSGGERAFLSRRAGGAEPATLGAALDWSEAAHLHIAEFATLAEIPGLVARAKAKRLTVSLDPSWDETLIHAPDFLERCAGVDIFLPNAEEAEALTGLDDPNRAIALLAKHFPMVALKRGAGGALLSAAGIVHAKTAPKVEVLDTTGAGDAFNAGLLDAWLDGRSAEHCLGQAIAAGSQSVQALGGTTALAKIARAG